MKIAVCGCSWSCRDKEYPDIEFGNLIASYYNADYINLAKPACSNFGIALQIQYILDNLKDVDLVVINATTVTRTELKYKNRKRYMSAKGWDNVDMNMAPGEKFRDEDHPSFEKGTYDPTILIDSFGTMFIDCPESGKLEDHNLYERYKDIMDQKAFDALKKYIIYWFNPDIERHKQSLILQNLLFKLQKRGINFVFSPNTFEWAEGYDEIVDDEGGITMPLVRDAYLRWELDDKNLFNGGIADYLNVTEEVYGNWDSSYGAWCDNHLTHEAHVQYAREIIKHINKYELHK